MNQILSVDPEKGRKKKGNKASTHSVLVVFAIILMIFGIGLTSTGAYSYYKNLSNNLDNNIVVKSNTKPIITTERENSSTINITITHDKGISEITYTINDEQPIQISGENKTEIKKEVELPVGDVSLNITAKDINGISSSYQGTFKVDQKPVIKLEQVEGKIQATTESKINIDYVKYYWDENEAEAKQFTINDVKNVTLIDVLEGTHTLNIVAVDIEGNETKKTQKIIGDNKPEVKITTDGKAFIINAKDDENLSKIEITLNNNEMIAREINEKEYSTTVDLENGENRLTVTVYNKNGLSEVSRVKFTKE
jgi:hypothetical protein